MTALDLRIKFKIETGEWPLWNEENKAWPFHGWMLVGTREFFRGGIPKSIYGLWLEKRAMPKSREQYRIDTGCYAAYPPLKRKMMDCLSPDYVNWLEDQLSQN